MKSNNMETDSNHYYHSENMDKAEKSLQERLAQTEQQNEKLKKEIDMRNRDIINLKQEIKKLKGRNQESHSSNDNPATLPAASHNTISNE